MLHIFGKQPMDVRRCAEAFRELYPDRASRVVVLSDVVYAHAMGECRGLERGPGQGVCLWQRSELCRARREEASSGRQLRPSVLISVVSYSVVSPS